MRQGAFDYITKPFKADELQVVVEKALAHGRLLRENRELRVENSLLKTAVATERAVLVGESRAILRVHKLVDRYADSAATVLIRGATGAGKEVVARLLHQRSPRRGRAFVCVNCAALSAGLLESELFGHEKGAFTGADSARQGRFEIAEGGTILLDEVSEIDLGLQSKLLRVLQERTFERVGSSRSITADVRVLATSNRQLEEEVRAGRFREDLFFRLNVLPIEIPPLCERKEDVPLLVRHFLERIQRRAGGRPKRLDPEAERALVEYDWPGNVRELANVIERAWVLTDGEAMGLEAFPGIGVRPALAVAGNGESADGASLASFRGMPLRAVERILIRDALRRYRGHQKRTASELGIGVRTLRSKIRKWRLEAVGPAPARDPGEGAGEQEQEQEPQARVLEAVQ
jgi:DNA-binding NtrC family response regulator